MMFAYPLHVRTDSERCRVVVADDDIPLRQLIVTALRRARIGVIEPARDGAGAIERLRGLPRCTVLVLDLVMPRKNGWDVIDWLAANRSFQPHTVVVVSTADREILRALNPSVVNAIIFKPFDVMQLQAYVKAACELTDEDRRHGRIVDEAST